MTATPVLHLIHRAEQVASAAFAEKSAETTPSQMRILSALSTLENPSQTDVVSATGIDRSTVADVVRRLVKKGFIARKRSKVDARTNIVVLTEAGVAELAALEAAATAADERIVGSLPVSLRGPFVRALQHIAAPAVAAAE